MRYLSLFLFFLISSACNSKAQSKPSLYIGEKTISIEIADTNKKRQRGLMYRKSLQKDTGMLFIFESKQELSFWMKNTLIPLSIAFIDDNCKIINIHKMYPAKKTNLNPPTYSSESPSLYALETNINWFERNSIKIGQIIKRNTGKFKFCN